MMQVTNPYTMQVFDISELTSVDTLFSDASDAFDEWRSLPLQVRLNKLQAALNVMLQGREQFIELMASDVGKPVSQGALEFDRAVEEWRYLLNNGADFLSEEILSEEICSGARIQFAPLGVVAVISPWNFPLMLPLRGILPALVAGNSVIFKPSELSPRVGMALSDIFKGNAPVFLALGGKELGAQVARLPVRAIAFTGSTRVGKEIAREAASSLKRVVLELGGLDAAIVLSDADIDLAAKEIVWANARNTGQVCNAVKRALVHRSVFEIFLRRAVEESRKLRYGDPLLPTTDVGPLVSKAQWDRVKGFLDDAVAKGAYAHTVPLNKECSQAGFIFPQVILSDLPPSARLLHEEPFGPLLPVLPFSSEQEAISIANDTQFGLTASVWTEDPEAFERIAARLDVGLVRRNTHAALKSGIPWGGAKESGVGRMKTREGLREFTNLRVVA